MASFVSLFVHFVARIAGLSVLRLAGVNVRAPRKMCPSQRATCHVVTESSQKESKRHIYLLGLFHVDTKFKICQYFLSNLKNES